LEQYAIHQQRYLESGGTIPPPLGPGPFPGSVVVDDAGAVITDDTATNGGGYEEEDEEDEEDDVGPSDEEEEDEDEDDPPPPLQKPKPAPPINGVPKERGLFNFGSSVTVAGMQRLWCQRNIDFMHTLFTGQGSILTVADDLLKNDGQKFLEMMEQLAERRMQNEEEAARAVESSEDEYEDDDDEEDDEEEGDDGVDDEGSELDSEEDDEESEEEVRYCRLVSSQHTDSKPISDLDGRAEDGGRQADVQHICSADV